MASQGAATTETGKTILSKTGSASGTFTLVAADATNRIKVTSLSLITTSATAVTVTFKSGAAGTALYTVPLQALANTNFGIAHSAAGGNFLFATAAATLLELSFSGAVSITYNIAYQVDDLT